MAIRAPDGANKERDLKFRDVVSVVNPVGRDLLSFLCTAGHQLDGYYYYDDRDKYKNY